MRLGLRGGDCGTWIVRDGMSQEAHRNARGTKLEPGDEIHFGKASARQETSTAPAWRSDARDNEASQRGYSNRLRPGLNVETKPLAIQ